VRIITDLCIYLFIYLFIIIIIIFMTALQVARAWPSPCHGKPVRAMMSAYVLKMFVCVAMLSAEKKICKQFVVMFSII
jgi:hypothetical protein